MTEVPLVPVVTVWRNKIPHPCVVIYWGRRWKITGRGFGKRLRWLPIWSAHSPIHGPERLCIDRHGVWSGIAMYHLDGSPLMFGDTP